jgi:hypothetical protein
MNVSTVAHAQAAVNFARDTGIRLAVKNTGHDLEGKSLGAGSLSVWTHVCCLWASLISSDKLSNSPRIQHLKDIVLYSNYSIGNYTGPAYKVGAGVQAAEIYQRAHDDGYMVVGGICDVSGRHYRRRLNKK